MVTKATYYSSKIPIDSTPTQAKNSPRVSHEKPSSKSAPCRLEKLFLEHTKLPPSHPKNHHQTLIQRTTSRIDPQTRVLKETNDEALILQKLMKLYDRCCKTNNSDNTVIKETLTILPTSLHNRLFFHLYLLHACQGKKTGLQYGEKAFKGSDHHSATHKERATAIHNLLLEQLAFRFGSLGHQKSAALMLCFTTLPLKDRNDIYFHTFQLSPSSHPLDFHYGKKTFHRNEHTMETNLLRSQAIYHHLFKRINASNSKILPLHLQRELEQLRNECGLLKETTKSEKEAGQKTAAAEKALLQTRLEDYENQVKILSSKFQEETQVYATAMEHLRKINNETTIAAQQKLAQMEIELQIQISLRKKAEKTSEDVLVLFSRNQTLLGDLDLPPPFQESAGSGASNCGKRGCDVKKPTPF